MSDVVIELSETEMKVTALVGEIRRKDSIEKGLVDKYGSEEEGALERDIVGARGELAVAKYTNQYWSAISYFKAPDVGFSDEVRTGTQSHYRLIIHPANDPDPIYWLVVGSGGTYYIKGWIRGRDGQNAYYWEDPKKRGPAFFVPDKALNPPHHLKEINKCRDVKKQWKSG